MVRLTLSLLVLWLVAGCAGAAPEPTNYALASNGATITGPTNCSSCAGQPPIANDGSFHGFAWAYLRTPTVVRFAEPQTINVVEMLLHDQRARWYQYRVQVSEDAKDWQTVAEHTTGRPRGWRSMRFKPTRCRFVKLVFTGTNVPAQSYHVVEIGAFHIANSATRSPLHKAYEAWEKHRKRTSYEVLLHYLGPNAAMTAEQRRRAMALPRGERALIDLDGDGDPDIADFVDTDPKHTVRPMLVRAIDDDDDMGADGAPDLDSDLYIADWRGNGRIDRAVDYWDHDGDGDGDRMDIYYPPNTWHGNYVEVVVIRDVGDDNKMWWTRNYEYQQGPCQWKSDFNGDEAFCMFYYDTALDQFVPHLEAPFTHHDLDDDGVSELTIQFLGRGSTLTSIRLSYDADNDSHPTRRRRDYDFSFNCTGTLPVPADKSTSDLLRTGDSTQPWLDWAYAPDLARGGEWRSCRLCWDEVDHNVNPASKHERDHERWEGVGGYAMREGNKRWETDADYSGRMQLYYWPADRRLHLFGAETGYIAIDYNHDYKVDAHIRYKDEDGDGFFDYYSYDADNDKRPEHVVRTPGAKCELVPINYDQFVIRYRKWVQGALSENADIITALTSALGAPERSPVEDWWRRGRLEGFYAGKKLGSSAEARRYYQDLIREELFLQAREQFSTQPWWAEFLEAYDAAQYSRAAGILTPRP